MSWVSLSQNCKEDIEKAAEKKYNDRAKIPKKLRTIGFQYR